MLSIALRWLIWLESMLYIDLKRASISIFWMAIEFLGFVIFPSCLYILLALGRVLHEGHTRLSRCYTLVMSSTVFIWWRIFSTWKRAIHANICQEEQWFLCMTYQKRWVNGSRTTWEFVTMLVLHFTRCYMIWFSWLQASI